MQRLTTLLAILCLVSCCAGYALSAERIEPDPRLAQKVTIDCTGVRLHTALEQISAKTGVTVHSGKSSTDWKVRDIPALVCARDIPLGVLLRAIADTNHLLLSRNRADDLITYRIWRDLKREKELDAFEETRQAAALAVASYDWDTLAMVKDLPEARPTDDLKANDYDRTRAISRLISELGPEVRDRVLSGEAVVVGMANLPEPIKPHLMNALQAFQKTREAIAARDNKEAPKSVDSQMNKCYVRIAFDNVQNTIPDQIGVELFTEDQYARTDYTDYLGSIKKNDPDLPPRPEVPKPVFGSDSLPASYAKIVFAQEWNYREQEWESRECESKLFETKFKVEALKDGEQPQYSNLLRMVSKEIGYSIVAEGGAARFQGVGGTDRQKLKGMFGREVSVREVLNLAAGFNNIDWCIDEADKLIVGRDKEWTEYLKALVPESLIVKLNDKMQNGEIDIDDLEPLVGLTEDQVREWIAYCPEYPDIQPLNGPATDLSGDRFSNLYFALDPKERKLAQSGAAVSLGSIDKNQLCKILRMQVNSLVRTFYSNGQMVFDKINPDMMRLDAFSNPDELPALTLRLQKHDLPKELVSNKHIYTIYVEESENPDFSLSYQMRGMYPIKPEDGKLRK